tara:strand:- start:386 stop:769 length:384 start_codon:yes stop_codon:yes gene_type:complete
MELESSSESDAELCEEEFSDNEDLIEAVLDRDGDESGLIYHVSLVGKFNTCWMSRSDIWDDDKNSRKIEAYDAKNPVNWDDACYYCKCSFLGPDQGEGCEECVCDICGERARHYNGVNYGCPVHAVI